MAANRGGVSRHPRPLIDLILPLISVAGLYWFSASFFLAKRSIPYGSKCDEADELLRQTLGLIEGEIATNHAYDKSKGCWLERRVDSIVILLVDALRFDFALHELPLSVGSRLKQSNGTTSTQLLQFVADPPTVTMQRLKGLTTGSLPTFADISGNFGGSSIDEDSWVHQLKKAPFERRGLRFPSRLGFVGDDTWTDLFPTQFDISWPYPSFNTRDLDTVDNGCLKGLPILLNDLRTTGESPKELEVIVTHFLGVDHVGHTYGPHNRYMHEKLSQIDAAISTTLDIIDKSTKCHVAFVFGDHGMTEDGNHGGGTEDEINAALFAHFSPACGSSSLDLAPQIGTEYVEKQFQSIHQIDLVPTISVLLGLPIPYANLGSIVPSLLGFDDVHKIAAALALNAAQLWRYFIVYSTTANKLPGLTELESRLNEAVAAYKEALAHPEAEDSNLYYKACGLLKLFLVEASELGHRVWTRFDSTGMILGGTIVFLCLAACALTLSFEVFLTFARFIQWDVAITLIFVVFQCGLLTFSNSYIAAEQGIVMFMMGCIGFIICIRWNSPIITNSSRFLPWVPLLLPSISRIGEVFVSGHGMDPSIRLHVAHHPIIFLSSLMILAIFRVQFHRIVATPATNAVLHTSLDCLSLVVLALAWLEKRVQDDARNGYFWMRCVLAILFLGMVIHLLESFLLQPRFRVIDMESNHDGRLQNPNIQTTAIVRTLPIVSKALVFIMAVTGPATAATTVLFVTQVLLLYILGSTSGAHEISSPVLACLWRFLIRHTFFTTNHGCAFNRLQYSAAFVATMEFHFTLSGTQLFFNTFGWEIVGLMLVWCMGNVRSTSSTITTITTTRNVRSNNTNKNKNNTNNKETVLSPLWRWYFFYQLLETFMSCISVSILRRHLMVWAVYAPRFLFSAIFLVLHCVGQVVQSLYLVPLQG